MIISGIVAVAKNLAIGKGGKLPWHYSADLKFFKETTLGHTILMGSNTWRSIGRALPGRQNLVLSRRAGFDVPEGVILVNSKEAAMEFAKSSGTDLYIIGGAEVFREFAEEIEKWLVTEVPLTIDDADVFMPANFLVGFAVEGTRDLGDGLLVKFYSRSRKLM
jgi:dihydrofolate reductase